jgi:hypothetical protein
MARKLVGMIPVWGDDDDSDGCTIMIAVLVGLGLVAWIARKLAGWQDYDSPTRYVAAFYYYFLVWPVELVFAPWRLIRTEQLTSYPNLNLALAIMAVGLAAFLLLVVFTFLIERLRWLFFTIALGPLLLWAAWGFHGWLMK